MAVPLKTVEATKQIFAGLSKDTFDHKNQSDYTRLATRGLSEELVRKISATKGEPAWMLEYRLRGLQLFLEKPLKKVSSLEDIYEFSYPAIVRRANTIDVIWFNHRNLPYAFFEVEYSTDFQNSLGKYADLQDFNSKFILVSPIEKRRKFEEIINIDIFKVIKNRVQFVDFNYISALHTKTIEIVELQKVTKL